MQLCGGVTTLSWRSWQVVGRWLAGKKIFFYQTHFLELTTQNEQFNSKILNLTTIKKNGRWLADGRQVAGRLLALAGADLHEKDNFQTKGRCFTCVNRPP